MNPSPDAGRVTADEILKMWDTYRNHGQSGLPEEEVRRFYRDHNIEYPHVFQMGLPGLTGREAMMGVLLNLVRYINDPPEGRDYLEWVRHDTQRFRNTFDESDGHLERASAAIYRAQIHLKVADVEYKVYLSRKERGENGDGGLET